MATPPPFPSEAALCAAFIAALPEGWTAYPETGGFDILLARAADGFQIGIEAKLKLNARVIAQALERGDYYRVDGPNPDCRAVLVPKGTALDLSVICAALGVTVIQMEDAVPAARGWWSPRGQPNCSFQSPFRPMLPTLDQYWNDEADWHERAPSSRIPLPDYVPDVGAGCSAPVALTLWKIKAIKIAITIERRGYVTRADFKHHKISMSVWTSSWLRNGSNGGWVSNGRLPDFRAQHPVNYAQIKADVEAWIMPPPPLQVKLL